MRTTRVPAEPADSRFWRFSAAFYRLPGIERSLLEWQDRHGADVNVLLYLLYVATEGRLLQAADVARIDALASPWRQAVVAPLRAMRRRLKSPVGAFEPEASAALREEVKRIELAAERLLQLTLERLAPAHHLGAASGEEARARARIHLDLYRLHLGAANSAPNDRLVDAIAAWAPPA